MSIKGAEMKPSVGGLTARLEQGIVGLRAELIRGGDREPRRTIELNPVRQLLAAQGEANEQEQQDEQDGPQQIPSPPPIERVIQESGDQGQTERHYDTEDTAGHDTEHNDPTPSLER
jgi:hypothetical protein